MKAGLKYDKDKTRYDLIPVGVIRELAKVLTMGAKKYAPNSWQNLPDFNDRYYAGLLRHLMAWRRGEWRDPESGRLHLSHVLCNAAFLLWKDLKNAKRRGN